LAAAREEKKLWWKATFVEVVPWSPNMVASTRRVWVQLRDIPLHVWYEDFFKKVANLFGLFLDFDEDTVSRKRFDVANILISTKRLGRIDDSVDVKVIGAVFRIWVVEGLPSFQEVEGSVEEESESSRERYGVWAEEDEEGRRSEIAGEEEDQLSGEESEEEEVVRHPSRSLPIGP